MKSSLETKIGTRDSVAGICAALRGEGKRVGYTSGVFDILHPGHVSYLEHARALVDVLVVGVNSDSSVRANKGELRPIIPERDRVRVLAGLASVDLLFVFDERNNNANVTAIRPDVYIKAGDYSSATLTSKSLVEEYGGSVEIVPMVGGHSTTSIVQRIEGAFHSSEGETVNYERRPAVFLDRDGTIIDHVEYLSEPEKLREIPGSFVALKKLRNAGYRIVVITNQPGIGLGFFSKEDFYRVNREMMKQATAAGLAFDRVYYCPHSKGDACRCRKPDTLLIERAAKDLNIDLAKSFVIGDMSSDIQLAKNAGCAGVLVKTGQGGNDGLFKASPDITVADLEEAAAVILQRGPVLPGIPSTDLVVPASKGNDEGATIGKGEEQKVLEAVGKFAGDLGHDFNNILGSILACGDLIRQRIPAGDAGENIEEILRILDKATTKGISLSNKIRGYLRPGQIRKTEVSIRSCINEVIEVSKALRGTGCNLELVATEDLFVQVSEFTVMQMLLQLCENSLDAMQHLKDRFIVFHLNRVVVASEDTSLELQAGDYARVSLVDHGRGIAANRQEAVFHPFSSTKQRGIGKGLGLSMSMAKAIMKQHGGSITLTSTKEVGTTISLYFPLLPPRPDGDLQSNPAE